MSMSAKKMKQLETIILKGVNNELNYLKKRLKNEPEKVREFYSGYCGAIRILKRLGLLDDKEQWKFFMKGTKVCNIKIVDDDGAIYSVKNPNKLSWEKQNV